MADDSDACIERQLSKFEDLWLEACHSWPPSGFTVDTNSKLTWTITASLRESGWDSVAAVIGDIAQRWPWHTVYDVPQLHVTITGLGNPEYWMRRELELNEALRRVVAQYPSIYIRIQGLNLLRNTLVVQIIDVEDKLRTIVEQLAQHIQAVDPDANFRPGIHSQVWWTSVARLRKPITDDLADYVVSMRQTEFATASVDSIQIIETTKGSDLSQTRIISRHQYS